MKGKILAGGIGIRSYPLTRMHIALKLSAHLERLRCSFSPTPLLNLRGRGAQFWATYSVKSA